MNLKTAKVLAIVLGLAGLTALVTGVGGAQYLLPNWRMDAF